MYTVHYNKQAQRDVPIKKHTVMLSQTQIHQQLQSHSKSGGGSWEMKAVLVFVQVVSFGDGEASVLQDLHFDFLRFLFGLLLQPLLLQDLFNGNLLQDRVTGLIHVLERQTSYYLKACDHCYLHQKHLHEP